MELHHKYKQYYAFYILKVVIGIGKVVQFFAEEELATLLYAARRLTLEVIRSKRALLCQYRAITPDRVKVQYKESLIHGMRG